MVKFGKLKSGAQRYCCKACKRTFNDLTDTPLNREHDIKRTILTAYLILYTKLPPHAVSRLLNVPYSTIKESTEKILENAKFFKKLIALLHKDHQLIKLLE